MDSIYSEGVAWIVAMRNQYCPNTAYRGLRSSRNVVVVSTSDSIDRHLVESKLFQAVFAVKFRSGSICDPLPSNDLAGLFHCNTPTLYDWMSRRYKSVAADSLVVIDAIAASDGPLYEITNPYLKEFVEGSLGADRVPMVAFLVDAHVKLSAIASYQHVGRVEINSKVDPSGKVVAVVVLRREDKEISSSIDDRRSSSIDDRRGVDSRDGGVTKRRREREEEGGDLSPSKKVPKVDDRFIERGEGGSGSSNSSDGAAIPNVQSKRQFQYCYESRNSNDLWQRVCENMGATVLRNCKEGTKVMVNTLTRLIEEGVNDEDIYKKLYEELHTRICETEEYKRANAAWTASQPSGGGGSGTATGSADVGADAGRANNRTSQISRLLPGSFRVKSMLDVGCAEASITAALGSYFRLPKECVHGGDVRDMVNPETSVTFKIIEDGWKMSYPTNSFNLILALMSLHHIEELDKLLGEVYRVMEVGGYLIIREHDCYPENLSVYLDIVHGMYALVWKTPVEWPGFMTEYYSRYQPREYWTRKLGDLGFRRIKGFRSVDESYDFCKGGDYKGKHASYIKNAQRSYYAVYVKEPSR